MLGGLKSAGAGAKGIFDAAMNIAAIAARARAMEQSSQLVLKKIGTTVDKAFSSNILRGLDTVTGGQQEWETLAVTIEDTFDRFQDGLLKSIDGGSDYRLAFRRLVICGRSLSQARLAVAKANLQLAELMLRRQAAERSVQIAQTRLEEIEDKAAAAETLAQFVFNTTLDSKRSVYLAMEAYQRAFRYFTLSDDAPPLPRITDTVDAFSKAVADISTKVLARERLSPAPQTMLERIFELTAPEILTDLKSNGSTSWTLATSDSAFRGFGRVRVDRVRVLADGIKPGAEVEIRIRTSGVYEDKIPKGNVRMFVSEPLSKTFVYRGDWKGGDVGIQIDGDVARRYQDDFFSPTPFTTWTLSINGRGGSKIDLSALTGLKFYFRGEITEGARA